MHRTKVAEFFLARLTTRDHAAGIVGDLMEISPDARASGSPWRASPLRS